MTEKKLIKKKIDTISLMGYISILVIILSLANIGVRLTGRATDAGIVNVTIESKTNINFIVSGVDFGSGNLDLGVTSATIDTLGNVINGNWTAITQGFVIENIGNENVTLQLATGKNADTLLGGTNSVYQYNVSNSEASSCTESNVTLGLWVDVNSTSPGTSICNPLNFESSKNEIRVDIKLTIPSDANTGLQSDIFTATATAV